MISLDVTSLFTNVPRHLVIRSIINRWNEVKTQINLDLFLEIVEYCMEASYFCFEGQYYKQIFGTAMGSPLSPIVADIVLDSVISTAMESLPFEITFFRKYVDDIFMAIPRNTEHLVLDAFNSVEPRLQFTIESEEDRRLPFLDMTVIRELDQSLTTEWYAKPIASGRMLNYTSFHQPKHKINVANNFIHRVCSLTRNSSMEQIAKTIHQHLRRNNYPKQLINRLLNLYVNKRKDRSNTQLSIAQTTVSSPPIEPPTDPPIDPPTVPPSRPSCQPSPDPPPTAPTQGQPSCQPPDRPPTQLAIMPANPSLAQQFPVAVELLDGINNNHRIPAAPISHQLTNNTEHHNNPSHSGLPATMENDKIYRAIPYIPALSERITKILAKDYPHIIITTRQIRTINQLHTRVKFPINKDEISSIIYKIPCNNCESSYVGMTKNSLRKRLSGHRSNVNKLEKLMNDDNTNTEAATASLIETTTAMIQHCIQHNHRFNLDRTQIIDHSYKPSLLPFLEMCHITNTNNTVNRRTDIDRLSTTYAAVLHCIKNINERNTHNREQHTVDEE